MEPVKVLNNNKGILIVFEGIDGTGKTTQALKLVDELNKAGHPAVYFREPSDSRWGRKIREKAVVEDSLTPAEELDLFQMDRRENVDKNLKPAVKNGSIVVLDRYYFSTMAYQGAKGFSPEKIRRDNEKFALRPDLIFIFDLDPAVGLDRIAGRGPRDALFEKEDYLEKVRAIFLNLKGDRFIHIDASQSMDFVSVQIKKAVSQHFSYLD
jgi:dTMP kinase